MKTIFTIILSILSINLIAQNKCEKNLIYHKDKFTDMSSYRTPASIPIHAVKDFGPNGKSSVSIIFFEADSYNPLGSGKENIILLFANGERLETDGNFNTNVKYGSRQYAAGYSISAHFVLTEDLWTKVLKSPIIGFRIGPNEGNINKSQSEKLQERLSCLKNSQYK